ncbi:MAG TPA: GntR family transcriptional regulator [Candidatus Omnitrophica bacterium]|nr:GntR family transcriptional regulator [Candidatus Omnitrophota bacterium]
MKTKTKEILEEVKALLLNGRLQSGEKLTEEELASRFNVSRTPIREILKSLEQEGLIETRRKRGIFFRRFTQKEVEEVFDVRSVLEGFAAKLAATRIKKRDIEQLGRYSRRYMEEQKKGNRRKAEFVDRLFHEKILEISGNTYLSKIVKKVRMINTSFYLHHDYPPEDPTPYSHERIVEVLKAGVPEECERVVQGHIQWPKEEILKSMKKSEDTNKEKRRGVRKKKDEKIKF